MAARNITPGRMHNFNRFPFFAARGNNANNDQRIFRILASGAFPVDLVEYDFFFDLCIHLESIIIEKLCNRKKYF